MIASKGSCNGSYVSSASGRLFLRVLSIFIFLLFLLVVCDGFLYSRF